MFDLVSVLAATGGGTGVIVTVLLIAERVLKDRSHRLNMNAIAEANALEDLEHQIVVNAVDEIGRLADLQGRRPPSAEATPALGSHRPRRGSRAHLRRAIAHANELGVRDELATAILPPSLDRSDQNVQLSERDRALIRAFADGVSAVRRMDRAQQRRMPVEDIYLIDDDLQ
jgi:hypothetical protein